MRIQLEYMSVKNCWTIRSSYDFHPQQQRFQWRSCCYHTAQLRFKALSDMLPALTGAPRLVISSTKLVASAMKCYQVHPMFSPVLLGISKPITITPMVLLSQSAEIRVTLKAGFYAHPGSYTLRKSTLHSLHSTSSLTQQESSSD